MEVGVREVRDQKRWDQPFTPVWRVSVPSFRGRW
jgi:hypothetical protein